jgi:hypothetical protein
VKRKLAAFAVLTGRQMAAVWFFLPVMKGLVVREADSRLTSPFVGNEYMS